MDFFESTGMQTHQLKQELVPNFSLLDHHVQKEILHVIDVLLAVPDKKTIQEFWRQGFLQEAPLLRSHIWKLLLETLPANPELWRCTKKTNQELYRTLVDKFMGKYIDQQDLLDIKDDIDTQLWNQIELDTRRTHSILNFFQKPIDHTTIYLRRPTKNSDVLSRILYIWGKINPTVRYVQGMNQILAPLYYLEFQKYTIYAESEVFFMFSSLMNFLIDMHIKDMDESEHGIMGRMKLLNKYLKVVDYELWSKLQSEKIQPQYYSFRWLALLLAQEFGLYETMKLWDVMLSYDGQKRYFFLYCCCIAILKYRKEVILNQDFINILPAIQKLRDVNVVKIIQMGVKLYDKYSRVNIEKLYVKMNEEIQKQKIMEMQSKRKEQNWRGGKWNYSNMIEKTGTFLSKFRFPSNKK